MITCPVCGVQNSDLNVTCTSCKGYIQARVDTLDLFSTIWGLMESPRRTMKRIVLSQHKNYVLVLSSLAGIAMMYGVFWLRNVANTANAAVFLLGAILVGPLAGVIAIVLLAFMMNRAGALFGSKGSLRNAFAMASYASVPVVLSLVIVLPVKVAVFGKDFFGTNPHPMLLQPTAYTVLIGLDAVAALWSVLLLCIGSGVLYGLSPVRSTLMGLMAAAAAFGTLTAVRWI